MNIPSAAPHWFTSVMGTGVIAIAAASLPVRNGALAFTAWALASGLLVVVGGLTAAHYLADRGALRRYLLDPTVSHFYGAPAMALMTVGTGTLLVGVRVVGEHAATVTDGVLWTAGTALGLATAVTIPALQFTRPLPNPRDASAVWLMPVVPPMVSAAAGAVLMPHLPVGARHSMAIACIGMFGASGLAAFAIIAAVWNRLAGHAHTDAASAPTLWIALGPLGQSVTAAGLLADHAAPTLGVTRHTLTVLAVAYGIPVLGFAMLWLGIAASVTVRAARRGLPFTLSWWAFTFPVGTCVTGASSLAHHTGSGLIGLLAVLLMCLLLAGWTLAAGGTVRSIAAARASAVPALG